MAWDESSKSWENSGAEEMKTERISNPSGGEESTFVTCNVTKHAYIVLFEGPPPGGIFDFIKESELYLALFSILWLLTNTGGRLIGSR